MGPNKERLWNLWELGPSWLRVTPGPGPRCLPLLTFPAPSLNLSLFLSLPGWSGSGEPSSPTGSQYKDLLPRHRVLTTVAARS